MEFYDPTRPKLCFLDDNFFANPKWYEIIQEVKALDIPFQFKQGLDERLLTDKHIHEIVSWKKYDGDLIFAFDNIADKEIIEPKLKRIYELYPDYKKRLKFYCFCGFDRNNKWDSDFWQKDICDLFERAFILAKYSAVPYVMRYEEVYKSEFNDIYSAICAWCNQPSFFKKSTFREYCTLAGLDRKVYNQYKDNIEQYVKDGYKKIGCWKHLEQFEQKYPDISKKYFDIAGDMLLEYGAGKKIIKK